MAQIFHTIKRYNYDFDIGAGGPRLLQLWTSTGLVADIHFVPDGQPRPTLAIQPGLTGAVLYSPYRMFPSFIDLLRNEKPVRLFLDDTTPPGLAFLGSTQEPVGEEES
jgi:hypothetical protein